MVSKGHNSWVIVVAITFCLSLARFPLSALQIWHPCAISHRDLALLLCSGMPGRDVRVGPILIQIGPQMGTNLGLFKISFSTFSVLNLGLFKISFSTFWRPASKCTETDLKKSQICPIWGQSDPIWMPNLPSLAQPHVL